MSHFNKNSLQPVAPAFKTRGFYPLAEVMSALTRHFDSHLDKRWVEISKGVEAWNIFLDQMQKKHEFYCPMLAPEKKQVAAGLAYSLLEKVILRKVQLFLPQDDYFKEIDFLEDELFFDGDYIQTPALIKRRADLKVLEKETSLSLPVAVIAASSLAEAARRTGNLTFFDANTWSVRDEPRLCTAQCASEKMELERRWSILEKHAGQQVFYRSIKNYGGKHLAPSQIFQSVTSQSKQMIYSIPPRKNSPLWHPVLDELRGLALVTSGDKKSRSKEFMPLSWFATEFWNDPGKSQNRGIRPFHQELSSEKSKGDK